MGQALYRTYRPKKLSEVVGQEHITHTLEQALKQGKISHAYLFTGPRGVGKTSIARILAHEINDLTYDNDTHLDIIEIDAASNRRIDEIRELRDKVYVAPTTAKYKIYIIDEVHMLTREAFNALLKTLEEPPAHAIFILATTDAHKLPETIISRTQRFNFKPGEKAAIAAHLKHIAKQEKIKIDNEALELLATYGDGSFRDSVGLLDQASSHSHSVDAAAVRQLLGIAPAQALDGLLQALNGSTVDLMQQMSALYDQGYQPTVIAKQLAQQIRTQLVNGQLALSTERALQLLAQLIEVPVTHDPERFLEIVLLQARTDPGGPVEPYSSAESASAPMVDSPVSPSPPEPAKSKVAPEKPEVVPVKPTAHAAKTADKQPAVNADLWPQILTALKQKHNTIYSIVRMAEPVFPEEGGLELRFAFAFHQKQLNETANRQLVADIVHELSGQKITITCVLDVGAQPPATTAQKSPPQPAATDNLEAISSIFGGGEVLGN